MAARYQLLVPGFFPIEWRPPRRPRLFGRRKNMHVYEEAATAALCFFLERRKIRTFMDIGAADGYFSRLALNYRNGPIDVHAFEMQPNEHAMLVKNLEARPVPGATVKALLCGMSDQHLGKQEIWYSLGRLFENEPDRSDYRESALVWIKFALRGQISREAPKRAEVTITSIDHYCLQNDVVPDVIKIDVEGYEAKVIPGGLATFRRHRPLILLELHRHRRISRFGTTRREIVRPLFEMGYRAVFLEDHTDHSSPARPATMDSPFIDSDRVNMAVFY